MAEIKIPKATHIAMMKPTKLATPLASLLSQVEVEGYKKSPIGPINPPGNISGESKDVEVKTTEEKLR